MRYNCIHNWDLTYDEAVKIQTELSSYIILQNYISKPRLIAGADVSYSKGSDIFFSGVVVFDILTMAIVEEATAYSKVSFPYIPGLLSFRESPVLLKAFEKLANIPDLAIIDGQGIAHPRGLGIASHIGLILNIPTIGCAKNVLVGKYEPPGIEFGESSPILYKNKNVGVALRTKKNVSPVFVSPGHKIDIESSMKVVLDTCDGYRLPEPIRQAHLLVNKKRLLQV